MNAIIPIDLLIIGSGPSGSSTALHLVRHNPNWAQRMIILDKAVHPRDKLCGGGITFLGLNILTALGLELEPNHIPLQEAQLVFEDLSYTFHGDPVFSIVRRAEFDHWLVQILEKQGVPVHQGEGVTDITPTPDYVIVTTDTAIYHAQAVVVADGSRSFVRQRLKWPGESHVARLIEVDTPADDSQDPLFQEKRAIFDFSAMTADNLQGYYWDFPSYVAGEAKMNRGVFDSRAQPDRPKASLKKVLADALDQRQYDLADHKIKGHPIRWFDADNVFAQPRIILVGDAAGVDPFMGEGISFALGYGTVAAQALTTAFAQQEFSFSDYRQRILQDPLLKQLVLRTRLARFSYLARQRRFIRWGWRAMQTIIKWTRWRPNYKPVTPVTDRWDYERPLSGDKS
ncbi:MAG TPA: FAD-dependent monooxygenase [Anaerolineae bacterium]|nr:FAD-dependent monooxygenase [Anaerolineae bacterium]